MFLFVSIKFYAMDDPAIPAEIYKAILGIGTTHLAVLLPMSNKSVVQHPEYGDPAAMGVLLDDVEKSTRPWTAATRPIAIIEPLPEGYREADEGFASESNFACAKKQPDEISEKQSTEKEKVSSRPHSPDAAKSCCPCFGQARVAPAGLRTSLGWRCLQPDK